MAYYLIAVEPQDAGRMYGRLQQAGFSAYQLFVNVWVVEMEPIDRLDVVKNGIQGGSFVVELGPALGWDARLTGKQIAWLRTHPFRRDEAACVCKTVYKPGLAAGLAGLAGLTAGLRPFGSNAIGAAFATQTTTPTAAHTPQVSKCDFCGHTGEWTGRCPRCDIGLCAGSGP